MTNLIVRADGVTELSSSVIVSCAYAEEVNNSTNVRFGSTTCATLSVTVLGSAASMVTVGEALTYYVVDENNVRTKIGVFYADQPKQVNKTSWKVEAYDTISKLDKLYSPTLYSIQDQFPMTLSSFVTRLATFCGVSVNVASLPNGNYPVKAFYADDLTCRELMGYAAEISGTFLKCSDAGVIEFKWYQANNDYTIAPSATTNTKIPYMMNGLSYETYTTSAIQRVQIHQSDNDIGVIYPNSQSGVTYEFINNILLTGASTAELSSIAQTLYNKLSTLTYTPCTAKLVKNKAFRAGDIVSVATADGTTFTTLVMSLRWDSNGATVKSTGDKSLNSTQTVATRKWENMTGRMMEIGTSVEGLKVRASDLEGDVAQIEVDVEGLSSQVESLEDGAIIPSATEPQNPDVGFMWLDTSNQPYLIKRYNGDTWDVVSDFSGTADDIYAYVNQNVSRIDQTSRSLQAYVSSSTVTKTEYGSFSNAVKNALEMTADGTTMKFERIAQAIDSVDSEQRGHYEEISKYIRFVDGNIILGEDGNELILTIENDILTFSQGGTAVAYFSNNKLYVTEAEILTKMKLGAFVYQPQNNGNMSLVYTG